LKKGKIFLDIIYGTVGSVLLAFAITSILKPNGLVTGGITGISIMMGKVLNINYTYIYYFLSVIVLLCARFIMGKREAKKIFILSILFPIVLIFFDRLNIHFIQNDIILASIYHGIIGGTGTGLLLLRGFSTGGTDTIAQILHYKLFPFVSISQILRVIDVCIIISSGFIYDINTALYAVITQIVMMKSIDMVLFGFSPKQVKVQIISDHYEEIADYILNNINRGISTYDITGGYTNSKRKQLVSICAPRESMLIRRFIAQVDPNAFVNVIPVISVWGKGEGFESIIDDKTS